MTPMHSLNNSLSRSHAFQLDHSRTGHPASQQSVENAQDRFSWPHALGTTLAYAAYATSAAITGRLLWSLAWALMTP